MGYGVDTLSILIITMGHNSVDLEPGVTVLFLYIPSGWGVHLYQVSRKYLERFQSYVADTISILINTKEHNSVKKTTRSYISCSLQIVLSWSTFVPSFNIFHHKRA